MSDETNDSSATEPTENAPTPEEPSPQDADSAAKRLLAEVASKVKTSAPKVYERYVDEQVEKEIGDRVVLLDKAMQKRFQFQGELKKVNRPDHEMFDADRKPIVQGFTKGRLEEIKKAKEALAKVENAIELALVKDEWTKLKETIK